MHAWPVSLAERGLIPDTVVRYGIRRLLRKRRRILQQAAGDDPAAYTDAFAEQLRRRPIAEDTEHANRQHYELPVGFFAQMLGPRMKYSACCYRDKRVVLGHAEEAMLRLTCARAKVRDGMDILELGCGWGSLTLWMAQRYPAAHVTAVTNSALQAEFIRSRAREAGVQDRVNVVKADINAFDTDTTFDRIVSVEMFEHVRNYGFLFERLAGWLKPNGKLFVHLFSHRSLPYLFETEGAENWMGKHFFSGGTMPSHDLLQRLADGFRLTKAWRINGTHYTRTLEDWLENLDRRHAEALGYLEEHYGAREARMWLNRWRMFLMACAELFAFHDGEEWGISHLLLEPT